MLMSNERFWRVYDPYKEEKYMILIKYFILTKIYLIERKKVGVSNVKTTPSLNIQLARTRFTVVCVKEQGHSGISVFSTAHA